MTVLVICYAIGLLICWRTLTGHMAWQVHRTAKLNPTVRPPIENWLACSVPCLILAVVWPVVMLFNIRWPLKLGAEQAGEIELRRVALNRLALENEKNYKALDTVTGEVLDADQ